MAAIAEESMVVVATAVVVQSKEVRMLVPAVAGVEETLLSIIIEEEPEGRE